jgi:hypothetical protein
MKRRACCAPASYAALCAALVLTGASASAATFSFVNMDGPGEGLNDAAPFTPVGGNTATTLGQARMNVLVEAGRVWGQQISSNITIIVEAKFDPLACTATMGTLGSAGARVGFANFSGAPIANVFYPAALADALSGSNLNAENDIAATFTSALDTPPGCLGGRTFYLGLNHQPGSNIDLLAVVLHELGHGLGFESVVQADGTSSLTSGRLSAFDQFLYSDTLAKFFPAMTAAERHDAIISNGSLLVWNGTAVNGQTGILTGGVSTAGHLKIYAPTTYSDGSSTSHWDTSAQWSVLGSPRSLLMEPFITPNPLGLTDITGCVLRDIGWNGTRCVDGNGAPVAQPRTLNVAGNGSGQISLLGTDVDTAGALTYSITTQPRLGLLTMPASLASTSGIVVTYTPTSNSTGVDTFTYQVSDGTSASYPETVTVNIAAINTPPVANPQNVNATAGTALAITLTGSDVEGSALTYTLVGSPAHGTLTGSAPNLSYTATTGYSGPDSFTFHVNDGALDSPNATVSITVSAPAAVVANSGGGGGGGSVSALSLLLLLCVYALRQRAPFVGNAPLAALKWGRRQR